MFAQCCRYARPLGEESGRGKGGRGRPSPRLHEKAPPRGGAFSRELNGLRQPLGIRVLSHNLKCVLLNDSAAPVTDVEVRPARFRSRFNLIATGVARIEAFRSRTIAADAHPSLGFSRFERDVFFVL